MRRDNGKEGAKKRPSVSLKREQKILHGPIYMVKWEGVVRVLPRGTKMERDRQWWGIYNRLKSRVQHSSSSLESIADDHGPGASKVELH
jgi:hypothetical protein